MSEHKLLFYNQKAKLQVRIRSIGKEVEDEQLKKEVWSQAQEISQRCYYVPHSPSTEIKTPFLNSEIDSTDQNLGFKGVITNGSIRDLDDVASNFQMLARSVLPSHSYLDLKSVGKTVKICGEQFKHNDIVHADQHGAVKIPLKYLENKS